MKKLFLLLIVLLILAVTAGAAYIYVPKAADAIYSKWVGPWLSIHKSIINLPGLENNTEGDAEAVDGSDYEDRSDAEAVEGNDSEGSSDAEAVEGSDSEGSGDSQQTSGPAEEDENNIETNPDSSGDAISENEKELEDRIIEAAEKIIGNGGLTFSKELLEKLSLEEMLKAYAILQSIEIEDRKEISRIVKKERSPGDVELVKEILKKNLDKAELEDLYALIVSRDWQSR